MSVRIAVLFVHVSAVIVAAGGSLFSAFVVTPILARELDAPARIGVARNIIRRQGAIVLSAMAILVVTGMINLMFFGFSDLLAVKLVMVAVALVLAIFQYGSIGARIWRESARGPSPEVAAMLARFRRVGMMTAGVVFAIVYLSLNLSRG